MANPALSRNPAFNGQGYANFNNAPQAPQYGQPGAYPTPGSQAPSSGQLQDMYDGGTAGPMQTGRMTYDDVVMRTGYCFAVLMVTAVANWFLFTSGNAGLGGLLTIVGGIGGLVLGLVNSFKPNKPIPGLILAYAGLQGLLLGGISFMFESQFAGIILQAVLATLCVFGVSLFAYRSKWIRVTPKFRKIFLIAMGGYLIFSLVNMVSVLVFKNETMRTGPLGLAIGLFAVGLAAFALVMDFDMIENGVKNGAPERFAWYASFGLLVTLIWLYIEMLRLISIIRSMAE